MSEEHQVRHADPAEGFDRAEPQSGAIVGFAVGSVILLILTIFALQAYFNKIWEEAVYEKILAPPSGLLVDLHNRENWNLTHYGYFEKKSGLVRVPVDKAMQEFATEAAAGKLFYPAKAYPPKKEEPAAGAAPAPAPGSPAANPVQ